MAISIVVAFFAVGVVLTVLSNKSHFGFNKVALPPALLSLVKALKLLFCCSAKAPPPNQILTVDLVAQSVQFKP